MSQHLDTRPEGKPPTSQARAAEDVRAEVVAGTAELVRRGFVREDLEALTLELHAEAGTTPPEVHPPAPSVPEGARERVETTPAVRAAKSRTRTPPDSPAPSELARGPKVPAGAPGHTCGIAAQGRRE